MLCVGACKINTGACHENTWRIRHVRRLVDHSDAEMAAGDAVIWGRQLVLHMLQFGDEKDFRVFFFSLFFSLFLFCIFTFTFLLFFYYFTFFTFFTFSFFKYFFTFLLFTFVRFFFVFFFFFYFFTSLSLVSF